MCHTIIATYHCGLTILSPYMKKTLLLLLGLDIAILYALKCKDTIMVLINNNIKGLKNGTLISTFFYPVDISPLLIYGVW